MARATGDDLPALKARLRLSAVIGKRVKLARRGGEGWGLCPFHAEKTESFSVNDAKGFFHCFGCGAHGDVLDWWRLAEGLTLKEAIERLKREAGEARPWREDFRRQPADDAAARGKRDQARAIWGACRPLAGTIAETYLREARCIGLAELPADLAFHAGLPAAGSDSAPWPAMVAAVRDGEGEIVAIQRTFLARDGSGKAVIERPKRALGGLGCGAVRLAEPRSVLGLAEGIETALSAMELFALPVWAALGNNFARIDLPAGARMIVLFGDRGEAGEEAAAKAALAFRRLGRRTAVRLPPAPCKDWNDVSRARRRGA